LILDFFGISLDNGSLIGFPWILSVFLDIERLI